MLTSRSLAGSILAIAGGALLGAALLANSLQVGGSPEFGWKQVVGAVAGGAALSLGLALVRRGGKPIEVPAGLLVAARGLPYAAAGVYAAYLGAKLRPNVMYDDAAITFRYVDRLTSGHGFTYNDHEHVLGTSNPLYTLVLSLLDLVGLHVETAARAVGLVCFVGAVLVAMHIATRLSNLAGGMVAGVLLASQDFFRYQALSGMESGMALLLGLLAVAFLLENRTTLAGVFLGLAIWNKLDAGLLAVAMAASYLLFRRRFPVRLAAVSTLAVAPWVLFATLYFGSPLPNSIDAKLGHAREQSDLDRGWITDVFTIHYRWLPVALGALALCFLGTMTVRQRVATGALVGWFVAHFAVFSLVDLGDAYPWYTTVLFGPPAILSGVVCGRVAGLAASARWRGLRVVALAVLPVIAALVLVSLRVPVQTARSELRAGNPPEPFETFDNDRRLAGIWLDLYAADDEVLSTCWGWSAYESKLPFDDTCHLNTKRGLDPKHYLVLHGSPHFTGSTPPPNPSGMVRLATFNLASDLFPGWSWFNVYALPSSQAARTGKRYLSYRLFELRGTPGVAGSEVQGIDLVQTSPAGATFTVRNERQPVHVVFSPRLDPPGVAGEAVFELRGDGRSVLRRHMRAGEVVPPVVQAIPGARGRRSLRVSFAARSSPPGQRVVWAGVKVIAGDAVLDLDRFRNTRLADEWGRRNPG